MSRLTKAQYIGLKATVDGASLQMTEEDAQALAARGLIERHQWMGNGQTNANGRPVGWLSATATAAGRELVAEMETA